MTPCSPSSFNRRFGETCRLHLQGRRNKFSKNQQASRRRVFRRVSTKVSEEHVASIFRVDEISSAKTCLPPACLLVFAELISSTLKMETTCSSEPSVETQRTTRRHIPEDDTLHNHRCEKLKSYTHNPDWRFSSLSSISVRKFYDSVLNWAMTTYFICSWDVAETLHMFVRCRRNTTYVREMSQKHFICPWDVAETLHMFVRCRRNTSYVPEMSQKHVICPWDVAETRHMFVITVELKL
jgi:hypothetical protein